MIRMDDRRNSSELRTALSRYIDTRGERMTDSRWDVEGTVFRMETVDARTLVLTVGGSEIVTSIGVRTENGTIRVSGFPE